MSGLLVALCFPTFHLHPLAWIALVPLFYRTMNLSARESFWQFFVAGWVCHTVLLQWLGTNIYWAGGWAVVGQQLMCIALALYWAILGGARGWIRGRTPQLGGAVVLAVLWMAMEQFQSVLFTGFGWSSLGYSQGPNLLVLQWASIGSGILISGFLIFVNGQIALVLAEQDKRPVRLVSVALVVVAAHLGGWALLEQADYTSRPLTVGVLQPNFPLEMKWDTEYTEEMVRNAAEKSSALAQHEAIDLMVWPEALVMTDIDKPSIIRPIREFTGLHQTQLFTGSVRHDSGVNGSLNSSYLIDPDGTFEGYYDKMHLAPFGEYVPFAEYFPFISKIVPSIGNLTSGSELRLFQSGDREFGPLICFEVLFPGMSERLRDRGADFLIVITNLGWFGASNAIPQELEIARMRAVETRLPLVHSANTGLSGVFDPWGRFERVDIFVDRRGNLLRARDSVRTNELIRSRLVGAFPLAAPGRRLFPLSPASFPWSAVGLCGVIIVASAILGGGTTASAPKGKGTS